MHSTTGHRISTAMRHGDMLLSEKIVWSVVFGHS